MIRLPLYCSKGSIIILSGPVQAGKTTALINMLNEHRNQTLFVKHNIEKRYHPLKIVTHNGKEIDCKVLSSIEEIKSLLTILLKSYLKYDLKKSIKNQIIMFNSY